MKQSRVLWLSVFSALLGLGGCAAPGTGAGELDKDIIEDCDGDANANPQARCYGQTEFQSANEYWDYMPFNRLEAGTRSLEAGEREVKEADIYYYDERGDVMYILSSYRGLQSVDVSNAHAPRRLGAVDLIGSPEEMIQHGNYAYVLLNPLPEAGERAGATLRVFDLTHPASPAAVQDFTIGGRVIGSRMLVAEDGSLVVYVAANVWSADGNKTVLKSFSLENATATPEPVQEIAWAGQYGAQIHVSQKAFYVTSYDYQQRKTSIQYVDISDLAGDLTMGGTVEIEGRLGWGESGALQIDEEGDVLRVASQVTPPWNQQPRQEQFIRISTIDVSDPARLSVRGKLDVAHGERLLATRFDGDMAFIFHMVQVDPLEIIDLSNPDAPRSVSILKLPDHGFNGWVSHIEKRGDLLLTLGVEDVPADGATPRRRKVAFLVFDVRDPANPQLAGHASAGQGVVWTSASYDLRSFRILEDAQIAMAPLSFSTRDEEGRYQYEQWLQVFEYDLEQCSAPGFGATAGNCVTAGGHVADAGGFRRAQPVDDRVITFSDRRLDVIDVSNPADPKVDVGARIELAVDVRDFQVIQGVGAALVASDEAGGKAELRIVDPARPDELNASYTLPLPSPAGKLYRLDAEHLVLVGSEPGQWNADGEQIAEPKTIVSTIVFDAATPDRPKVVGTYETAELGFHRWGGPRGIWWRPAPGPDNTLVGEALALYTWSNDGESPGGKLRIVDLSNKGYPVESELVDLGADTVVDMRAVGSKLYVTSYTQVALDLPDTDIPDPVLRPLAGGTSDADDDDATVVSVLPSSRIIGPGQRRTSVVDYSLRIIDLEDPQNPVVSNSISIPGKFVELGAVDPEGEIVFIVTMDRVQVPGEGDTTTVQTAFDALELVRDEAGDYTAVLWDVYGLPEGVDNVYVAADRGENLFIDKATAIFMNSGYSYWRNPVIMGDDSAADVAEPHSSLQMLNLQYPDPISQASSTDMGEIGNASLYGVQGNYAFMSLGYGNITVVDISNPALPQKRAYQSVTGGFYGQFYLDGDNAYLPGGLYGLKLVDLAEAR